MNEPTRDVVGVSFEAFKELLDKATALEAANIEKDAEIERLKVELAKTGTGDYKGDFYLGRKTLSGYLRDAEDDRDGWKRMYDAKKAELASLRALGGEGGLKSKKAPPTLTREKE